MEMNKNCSFALDIGTRSLVGILMCKENDEVIRIKNYSVYEHQERAMLDGQIHDVPKVTKIAKKIISNMNEKMEEELREVTVAAAGRSLITTRVVVQHVFDEPTFLEKNDVLALELKGVHQAKESIASEGLFDNYCVGYSVTKYFIDEMEIGNLEGQKAKIIGLEILAAFLPKIVIDSLHSVIEQAGLSLEGITLEPMAAINAIMPPTMRKLNIALVDIGAGTSDIAISKDNSIIAYGMVPFAGDEITEAISEKYILDFNEAETVKRTLNNHDFDTVKYTDVLGMEYEIDKLEIISEIAPIIEELAKRISDEILRLNEKSPQAVILIGGGSYIPNLPNFISINLGITKQRVAVQSSATIKQIIDLPLDLIGAEYVTPLGIGITALEKNNLKFMKVIINGAETKLLNLGQNTLVDALAAAGIGKSKLYGRIGNALSVEVNGKLKTFPGTSGERAKIFINGRSAELNDPVSEGDRIDFKPAKDGELGKAKLADIKLLENSFFLNGQSYLFPNKYFMNGELMIDLNTLIPDRAKIHIERIDTLFELLKFLNAASDNDFIELQVSVNGKTPDYLTICKRHIEVDGVPTLYNVQLEDNCHIKLGENRSLSLEDLLNEGYATVDEKQENEKFFVTINQSEKVEIDKKKEHLELNGQVADREMFLDNGDSITIRIEYLSNIKVVDVLSHINFSPVPPVGKSVLSIIVDNKEVDFNHKLFSGNNIDLVWK